MKTIILLITATISLVATSVSAGEVGDEQPQTPPQWLAAFAEGWKESAWEQRFRGNSGYMRPDDDPGWKLRMRALQGLVAGGKRSVPHLLKQLQSGPTHQRILAAQALSYLAAHTPSGPLLRAARSDKDATVRLYAIDALGMQADPVDWEQLRGAESNRDVRKHIGFAMRRGRQPLQQEIVKQLVRWDLAQMDSATVGKMAPDFTLQSATGESVKLSQFRDRKAVVLVFIYGDT